VPHYPSEDEKLRATSYSKRRGGNCPNTLEVLADLLANSSDEKVSPSALQLSLVAVLPKRSAPDAELIAASLPGVDLGHCLFREDVSEAASSFIVRSEEGSGSRTIVNWNALREMSLEEFVEADKGLRADWYHFEGRITETSFACIRYLRANSKAKISVELEKPCREGLQEMANEADVVFYSKSWAQVRRRQIFLCHKSSHLMAPGGEFH
jgi:ketohexokinase